MLRRWLFWTLLLLLVVLSVWWTVWFPYNPGLVRAVMPANAVLVSEHRDGLGRLDAVLANPLVVRGMAEANLEADAVHALFKSGLTGYLMRSLFGRYVLTGYVPYLPGAEGPAWIVAGWGGTATQVLRGMLALGLIDGVTRLPGGAVSAWRLDSDEGGPVFTFAFSRGVAYGCYAMHADGIRDLGAYVDRVTPLYDYEVLTQEAPDRLALRWSATPHRPARVALVGLDLAATHAVGLDIAWPRAVPLPAWRPWQGHSGLSQPIPGRLLPPLPGGNGSTECRAEDWDALAALLGDAAGLVVRFPADAFRPAASRAADAPALEALFAMLRPGSVGVAALLHEGYSGRVLGIKTPSLVLAFQPNPERDWRTGLADLLDALNATARMSLMSRPYRDGNDHDYRLIDSAQRDVLGDLREAEKPAAILWSGWLVVGSNLDVLRRLVSRDGMPPRAVPAWWRRAAESGAAWQGWVDFEAAGLSLRKAAAMYALVNLASGETGDPVIRGVLRLGSEWFTALEPLRSMSLTLSEQDRQWRLRAAAGVDGLCGQ